MIDLGQPVLPASFLGPFPRQARSKMGVKAQRSRDLLVNGMPLSVSTVCSLSAEADQETFRGNVCPSKGCDPIAKKLGGGHLAGLLDQPGEGELGGPMCSGWSALIAAFGATKR